MPKPVCVSCGLFYKNAKSGVTWEEMMPGGMTPTGKQWVPYKLWKADLYRCAGCGNEILVGHGRGPVAEHFHPNYEGERVIHGPVVVQVNDC